MKVKNLWCIHTAKKATVVRKAKTIPGETRGHQAEKSN